MTKKIFAALTALTMLSTAAISVAASTPAVGSTTEEKVIGTFEAGLPAQEAVAAVPGVLASGVPANIVTSGSHDLASLTAAYVSAGYPAGTANSTYSDSVGVLTWGDIFSTLPKAAIAAVPATPPVITPASSGSSSNFSVANGWTPVTAAASIASASAITGGNAIDVTLNTVVVAVDGSTVKTLDFAVDPEGFALYTNLKTAFNKAPFNTAAAGATPAWASSVATTNTAAWASVAPYQTSDFNSLKNIESLSGQAKLDAIKEIGGTVSFGVGAKHTVQNNSPTAIDVKADAVLVDSAKQVVVATTASLANRNTNAPSVYLAMIETVTEAEVGSGTGTSAKITAALGSEKTTKLELPAAGSDAATRLSALTASSAIFNADAANITAFATRSIPVQGAPFALVDAAAGGFEWVPATFTASGAAARALKGGKVDFTFTGACSKVASKWADYAGDSPTATLNLKIVYNFTVAS